MKLNVPTNIGDFKDHVRFYYEKPTQANIKKGDLQVKRRGAAKMFYKIVVNGMHFRIEIRFKNPIISSSPQFQVHKDHERTPSPESGEKISSGGKSRGIKEQENQENNRLYNIIKMFCNSLMFLTSQNVPHLHSPHYQIACMRFDRFHVT